MNWTRLRPSHENELPTLASSAKRRAIIERDMQEYFARGGKVTQLGATLSRDASLIGVLSNRASQLRRMAARGITRAEAARLLGISESTVHRISEAHEIRW